VVLAAGAGTRLAPLTNDRPKALCPVGNVAMVDRAISNIERLVGDVAVNVSHHGDKLIAHLADSVHISDERSEALGTAGAIGKLRDWIGERAVIVHNCDSLHEADLTDFVERWDGERTRLLVMRSAKPDFGEWKFCGVSLLPADVVTQLPPIPSGLWEVSWRELWNERRLDLYEYSGMFFDCGTHSDYLEANLAVAGSDNVVGAEARVMGKIERCVIWPNAEVGKEETLVDVIRTETGITVQC
jgi:N-acetyl-alpha-D-muramate 1-phosphate uridylyltransferase